MQNQKLQLLPVQIVDTHEGIVLRRGVTQIIVPNENVLLVMRVLQKAMLINPCTLAELIQLFAGPVQPLVESLLQLLFEKRLLVPIISEDIETSSEHLENETEVFYWHFNLSQKQISNTLNEKCWVFVGINKINEFLLKAMIEDGLENYVIVDDPILRNISYYDSHSQLVSEFWEQQKDRIISEDHFIDSKMKCYGFVIAASEFGGAVLLERWNKFSVVNDIAFYPVLLQNLVGYCGPLVIPKETACYTCVGARQNSNSENFRLKRLMENYASEGQHIVAYHRSMLQVLANVVQFQLVKFKSNIEWDVGTLCEINLLSNTMSQRKILKAPRCPVCSGLVSRPLTNLYKQLSSPEQWMEISQKVNSNED